MKEKRGTCELCQRKEVALTKHHLTPKERGGTFLETAMLCTSCHKQIHALYTNQELANRLFTIKKLQEDEKIAKYLKWIKKQSAGHLIKVKKANARKGRKYK